LSSGDSGGSSSSDEPEPHAADPEAFFFFEFERQLEKATGFYSAKAAALSARAKALQ